MILRTVPLRERMTMDSVYALPAPTVTWATAPEIDAPAVASLNGVTKTNWYEVDLTSLVHGDGPVGVAITSTAFDGAGYSSKEGPVSQRPELVVECGSP